MSEDFPLSLALMDFVPVFAFLAGSFYLVRIAKMVRGAPCSRMVMAGAVLGFLGGFLKAGWKLLYSLHVADIRILSEVQFIFMGLCFLAILVAVILVARGKGKSAGIGLMAIAPWKLPFLMLMVLTALGANGILTYVSFRRGAKLAAVGFIVAFIALLSMGGLASGDQTSAASQWIEEGINTLGQLGYLAGSILLYRNFKRFGC